jgi:hypothetical protein
MRIKRPAPAPSVEEVDSAETSQKETDVTDLQRTIAECEFRIKTLDLEIDREVGKRVALFMQTIEHELAKREMAICSQLIEFFYHAPFWEMERVTKRDMQPGESFYNPHELFRRRLAQGWRWVGQFFDEKSGDRYDLFLRPKNLPGYYDKIEEFYSKFKADRAKQSTAAKAPLLVKKRVVVSNQVSKTKTK